MSFSVCKNSNIILYGANDRGYELYNFFKQRNHEILYVIDREPQKALKRFDCQVICIDDINWADVCNAIVIVCMQNGLEHNKVADNLYNRGHKKIIFLPTGIKYSNTEAMIGYYQKLLEKRMSYEEEIPDYEELVIEKGQRQLIKSDEEMVTCWTTMEYMFTSCKSKENENLFIENNVSCWKPYLELFNYISGCKTYPHQYLDYFRADDELAKCSLLKDRNELYKVYEEKLNTDLKYFTYAAPFAVWDNEYGCFRVLDGHHRVAYLFLKGWYEIPVRVSRIDYEQYAEYKKLQLWNELDRDQIVPLYKICSELVKWMYEADIVITDVREEEETRNYVTWWLERNGMYRRIENLTEPKTLIFGIKNQDAISRDVYRGEVDYIITSKTVADRNGYKRCKELFCGFIGDIWEEIGVYYRK